MAAARTYRNTTVLRRKAEKPVNFVATVPSPDPVEVVDPRYKNHCAEALLIRPDNASRPINILRDTGALQSLVSSNVLTNDDCDHWRTSLDARYYRRRDFGTVG